MNTRYQGKSSALPAEWFPEKDYVSPYKRAYAVIYGIESDPEYYPNYSESEEEGWSTSSDEDTDGEVLSEGESSKSESEGSRSEGESSESESSEDSN